MAAPRLLISKMSTAVRADRKAADVTKFRKLLPKMLSWKQEAAFNTAGAATRQSSKIQVMQLFVKPRKLNVVSTCDSG